MTIQTTTQLKSARIQRNTPEIWIHFHWRRLLWKTIRYTWVQEIHEKCQQLEEDDTKTYQKPDAKETEWFWSKIWQEKTHNEKAEWINNITRELEGLKEGPKVEIHIDLLKTTLKTYQIEKGQAMMEYMFSGSRNSPPFMIDKCKKWTNAYKEQTYPNGWQKKGPYWSRRPEKRNHPKILRTNNLPTENVENINSTNKGRYLLLANKP